MRQTIRTTMLILSLLMITIGLFIISAALLADDFKHQYDLMKTAQNEVWVYA